MSEENQKYLRIALKLVVLELIIYICFTAFFNKKVIPESKIKPDFSVTVEEFNHTIDSFFDEKDINFESLNNDLCLGEFYDFIKDINRKYSDRRIEIMINGEKIDTNKVDSDYLQYAKNPFSISVDYDDYGYIRTITINELSE